MFKLLQRSPPMPPSIPATSRLRKLQDYWSRISTEGVIPGRQHVQPGDIPGLLPYILILDYTNGQYRCRLAGTAVVEGLGQELTGRVLDDELLGSAFAGWFRRLETVRRRACPLSGEECLWWLSRSYRNFHWLCLPLASDGQHVDKLLMCIDWS